MITSPMLNGKHVRLEPLVAAHCEPLFAAASADRSAYGLTLVPATLDKMREYVDGALAEHQSGVSVPFAVLAADSGAVIGSTRFLDIECWPGAASPTVVEIGHTWIAGAVQRTAVNTEMKYLMLAHAFD